MFCNCNNPGSLYAYTMVIYIQFWDCSQLFSALYKIMHQNNEYFFLLLDFMTHKGIVMKAI